MNKNNLIWIDLEMTGLCIENNYILEIATLVTDSDLNILAEGPVIPIYQSEKILNSMNYWNYHVHTNNGLITKVQNSLYNEKLAEKKTMYFLNSWIVKKKSPMCGNSIHCDRKFLLKYMPKLESFFHYRNIDVSTLKELVLRWKPKILKKIKKNNVHSALHDIYSSISELLFYKKHFIKN